MANFGAMSVQVIYSASTAKGRTEWRNNYELDAPAAGVGVDFQLVADAFADAFLPLLLGAFVLDRVVIGTLAEDGKPYNPSTFAVLPVGRRGTRGFNSSAIGSALPLSNVLHVSKLVDNGRLGNMLLRGFLAETDIESDANGGVSLTDRAAVETQLGTAYSTLQAGLGGAATLALISGSGVVLNSRDVTGFRVRGLTSKGMRNQRKTYATRQAVSAARNVLGDGGITLDEIPQVIEVVGTLLRALGAGASTPPLLP